ncbi:MAG: hypothetical protein DCC50_00785 [Acidobacteria bacterium]|nr:MAG: hypothetical protein DCC50_00785 [Acidobacteriota bacterium]
MTRALTRAAATAAVLLMLAACDGTSSQPDPTTSGTTASESSEAAPSSAAPSDDDTATATQDATPEPELNTPVPAAGPVERTWPQEIKTISQGEREFTLFGVHRLDDTRAVVTGRIRGASSSTAAAQWFEPGFLHTRGGYEFSRVAVVDQDDVRHLPVRDKDDRCLCSLSTAVYQELGDKGQAPAWAVVSLPADAESVDVEVADVGVIEDVPVTPLPDAQSVPFGWDEVLTIDKVTRADGVVTARTTMINAGDFRPSYTLARHEFEFPDLQGQHCFQGLAAYGPVAPTGRMAKDPDCHRGSMVEPGQQITLEVKIADPGGERLVILPDAGLPVTTPAEGSPAEGARESLRAYATRTEEAGATVEEGEALEVSLDTSVLFDFDKAKLTGKADQAIAVAVKTLKAQDKRAIVVAGHTDGQGSAARNDELSEQRAKAVAAALQKKLGSGWKISVEWHGSSQPVADETGSAEQVKAAQARNRRVEITVP